MDYLNDQEIITAFYNLVGIQAEIYDLTMDKLLQLEKEGITNPLEFNKIIKKINNLKIKENRIYEKLDTSEYYYGLLDIVQSLIREISIDDEKKYKAIDVRLDYHFSELFNEECMIIEMNENIYDYIDIDDDYEGNIVIIPEFKTMNFYAPLQIEFISELMNNNPKNEEYLKYKYYNSFTHPSLEDNLVLARYNPNNICNIDDELKADAYDIELEEYKECNDNAIESFAETAFTNFIDDTIEPEITDKKLDLSYKEVLFSASKLSTKKLAQFVKKHFNYDDGYNPSLEALDYFEKLGNNLLEIIFNREDYDETILNILNSDNIDLNFSNIKFDNDTYNNLFNMINISKEIYYIAADLYYLDLINKKDSKEYSNKINILEELAKKEKEYAIELDFDKEEKAAVKELIQNYLEFIYNLDSREAIIDDNETNIDLINKRIINILWNEKVPDLSLFKDESVVYAIIKNYQLECLNEYEKSISNEEKKDHLAYKYLEIISDDSLTDEFIFEKGCIENTIILDDEITSKILGIELEEYLFDKNNIITSHVYDIMTSLAIIPKDYELKTFDKATIDYQTVALEVALKYIDEEELEEFKSNFISSEMIENSILNKKLKNIFNKEEKKLELSKKRH